MLVLVVMVEVGGGGAGGVGSVTGCGSRVICGLFALLLPFVLPCLLACLRACLLAQFIACLVALLPFCWILCSCALLPIPSFFYQQRSIGLRRQKNALIVIQTAIPPLLELLLPSVNTRLTGGSSGSGEFGGDSQLKLETAGLERALSSLVELSDIPGVFKKAVSAMLAGGFVAL